jgi:hypothetical protein
MIAEWMSILWAVPGTVAKWQLAALLSPPCLGFILDNLFGNEYCFYPNGPGHQETRHRGVTIDPPDKKK